MSIQTLIFTDLEIKKKTEIFSRSHGERAGVRIQVS